MAEQAVFGRMQLVRFYKGRIKNWLAARQLAQVLTKSCDERILPQNPSSWPASLKNPTAYYLNCVRFFHQKAPGFLKNHRAYFRQNQRGFGEDAFHVMWYGLCQVCRPASFLEIGVYRGQVLSLVSLLAKSLDFDGFVCGVSPFTSAGDTVSKYSPSVDYWTDTLANFNAFDLGPPRLIKGMSDAKAVIQEFSSRSWDFIYIDGNHEYDVAKKDFLHCAKILNPGGKIVLDDSALLTSYRPPLFATAGHPGPSRLAAEVNFFGFQEILQVGHNRVFQKKS